jgi:SAM-dependent methyltransferase
MSDQDHFQEAYAEGATPPWDIGRPQPALVDAERRGWVRGAVLDAGCGTGEHALFFAAAGHDVVGVDVARAAIARATAKVAARNHSNPPRFVVADILTETQAFGDRTYDTVVDMGFFHTLDDDERTIWRSLLARLLAPGGGYVMVCFSELVPGSYGPRRISEADIRETFAASEGFAVTDLERTELRTHRDRSEAAVQAWLTRIERV